MKKKIGIITFYNAHNHGAMLQAMALQDYLSEKYDVSIINYRNHVIDNRYKFIVWEKKQIKNIMKNIVKLIFFSKKQSKRDKAFENFLNKNFNLTKKYNTEEELKKDFPKYDIYITGSDQVWNTKITNGVSDIYTLNFGSKKTKRISYAASFGVDHLEKKEQEEFKSKLEILDDISVREETAVKILKEITDKKIYEVLDPTFLVSSDYWYKKTKNIPKEKHKYILAYQLDINKEYVKIVNFLSKKLGYKVVYFNKYNKFYDKPLKSAFTKNPIEFVNLIKNAEFVVNTSFHGTVFSTIFHKQFLVIPRKDTGSRMIDFLKKIELDNRIIYNLDQLKASHYMEKIDFTDADRILEKERKKSIEYLNSALEKGSNKK